MPEIDREIDETGSAGERLSLEELAALAGLSARTVRWYIQEGLVSRPVGSKRGAWYTRRHLEQLLLIRRWTDAGLSLARVRELIDGAPEDAPRRGTEPGAVEVWSRLTLADGLEVHVQPARAGLSPEALRELVRSFTSGYRQVRLREAAPEDPGSGGTVNTSMRATLPPRPIPDQGESK
jgi:DNA-binding transcriptional MerR regulator